MFLSVISLEEAVAFTNYSSFPSSILIGGVARRQGGHLRSGGRGNFGSWGLADWVMGTSIGGGIEEDIQEELDEHDVADRAEGVWEGVKEGGRKRVSAAVASGRKTRGRAEE